MASHAMSRHTARGFTLVELLVALVVMSLLSLMSWRGLEAMGRAQTQTQTRADDLQALQSGLAQWGTDLDAMVDEASALDWNGQVLRITRFSSNQQDSGLRVVAWTLGTDQERKAWLRWQSPVLHSRAALQDAWLQAAIWAQNPTLASRARQVRITPMADWQIFYSRGGAWTNPGSSSDEASQKPDGVRLQITLPDDQPLAGVITRDWIRPTAVGSKS